MDALCMHQIRTPELWYWHFLVTVQDTYAIGSNDVTVDFVTVEVTIEVTVYEW